MAQRRSSNNNSNNRPLPRPDNDGGQETNDKIEEPLFQIQQEEKAAARAQQQPQTTQRRGAPRRTTGPKKATTTTTNLSLSNKKGNNCCNCCDDMLGMLSIINDSVSKVLSALKAENLLDKKKTDEIRKNQEEKDRRDRENLLESSGRKMSRTLSTVVAPIKNAMEAIFKFILFTLAGRAITGILKWFADPSNKKKVQSLTRFLKDWWPALLGAFVLFGTRFGSAIRSSVKLVVGSILYLKKIGIVGIIAGLKKFGIPGLAIAAVGTTALIYNSVKSKEEEKGSSGPKSDAKKGGTSSPGMSRPAFSSGGLIRGLNFLLPEERHVSEIAFADGGHIDGDTGLRITGAGADTQLIAAQPGEVVMSKAAVDKYGADTFLNMNKMAGSSNQPKFANNIQFAQQGGMVGGIMNGIKSLGLPQLNKPAKAINSFSSPSGLPKINRADYNALLAIAAAEDSDPQGRADVAQSIYNRLYAGSSYGMNFMPTGGKNTIKGIITGEKQYEPTFKNRADWLNINDRKSAATALANSKKIDLNTANNWLDETEKALKNKQMQINAQNHVGGRPSFFGTSQHKFMKGDDVLRKDMVNGKMVNRKDNFFTNYPAENSKYHQERGNTAAPIPGMLYSPQGNEQSSLPMNGLNLSYNAPTVKPPGPSSRAGTVTITELPPINLKNNGAQSGSTASPDVPNFPTIPAFSDRYGPTGTLAVLEINA